MPKTNGKKRQSPSVERQLALVVVRMIECLSGMDDMRARIEAIPEGAKMFADLGTAVDEARQILTVSGYSNLESIAGRVARIQDAIAEALRAQDGAKLAQLGAALDRAKKGLPPLTTEKTPRTPRKPKMPKTPPAEPKEKKSSKKSGKSNPLPIGDVPCHCEFTGCTWKGVAVPDSPCPVCSSGVVADK